MSPTSPQSETTFNLDDYGKKKSITFGSAGECNESAACDGYARFCSTDRHMTTPSAIKKITTHKIKTLIYRERILSAVLIISER
jgi:hypothetical protein